MFFTRVLLLGVRSAEPPISSGNGGDQHVQHVARCHASRQLRLFGRDLGLEAVDQRVEIGRHVAGEGMVEAGAGAVAGGVQAGFPVLPLRHAALAEAAPDAGDFLGDDEVLVRPGQLLAGGLDLVGAQRRAVAMVGAALGGRAIADDGLAGDQRGRVGGPGVLDRGVDLLRIVAVDLADVPAIGPEAVQRIVGEAAGWSGRRSRSGCRPTARSAWTGPGDRRRRTASWLMPSIRSPSLAMT